MPTFKRVLDDRFAGAMRLDDYMRRTHELLDPLGFTGENTFACVGVCRDEITRELVDVVNASWGEAFNFSSLAGMPFLGKTGVAAAIQHAPEEDGHERYIYFSLPHVAIDSDGTVGRIYRPGIERASTACGALIAFRDELLSGHPNVLLDIDDVEQSLLKQILIRRIPFGQVPDVAALTHMALDVIVEMMEHLIELTVDRTSSSYALMSGIQIHCPENTTWVWPGRSYAVIDHKKQELKL